MSWISHRELSHVLAHPEQYSDLERQLAEEVSTLRCGSSVVGTIRSPRKPHDGTPITLLWEPVDAPVEVTEYLERHGVFDLADAAWAEYEAGVTALMPAEEALARLERYR